MDMTKTRIGLENGLIHKLSQTLWKASHIIELLFINHSSTSNYCNGIVCSRQFQGCNTTKLHPALQACICVSFYSERLSCLQKRAYSLAVTQRHKQVLQQKAPRIQ